MIFKTVGSNIRHSGPPAVGPTAEVMPVTERFIIEAASCVRQLLHHSVHTADGSDIRATADL